MKIQTQQGLLLKVIDYPIVTSEPENKLEDSLVVRVMHPTTGDTLLYPSDIKHYVADTLWELLKAIVKNGLLKKFHAQTPPSV